MPWHEQLKFSHAQPMYAAAWNRAAQRLMISDRTIYQVGFYTFKDGTPPGNVTFAIRRVSDDSVIVSKSMLATGLPEAADWVYLAFADPTYVNEEVRICEEYSGGTIENCVRQYRQNTDVKPDEYFQYFDPPIWTSQATQDNTYKYEYTEGELKPAVGGGGGPASLVAAGII